MLDVVVVAETGAGGPMWAAWALIGAALFLLALFVLECERGQPPAMHSHWGGIGGGLGGWRMSKSLAYLLTSVFIGVLAVLVLLPPKSDPPKPARTPRTTSTGNQTPKKKATQEPSRDASDAGTARRPSRDSK